MPAYGPKFLHTQIGRAIEIHFEPPHGARRKAVVKGGSFVGVSEHRQMIVRVFGEEYPTHVDIDADQPAFATGDQYGGSVWWKWAGPQLPLPTDLKDD
jgi:hypothetical protein